MKAISIKQPWAWLIVNGYKDIENRSWSTNFRGRVYIHASLSPKNKSLPGGCIVGEVDIIDCVTESKSRWFSGKYGFVLSNPIAYNAPIPCKGQLGFFSPKKGPVGFETKAPRLGAVT